MNGLSLLANTIMAGAPRTPVVPAAVTFNDTGNVTTVPSVTGARYLRSGTPVTAGTISNEPGGLVTYTAVALAGYVIAGTASWSHTYATPAPINVWPSSGNATLLSIRPQGRLLGTLTVDPAFPVTATNFWTVNAAGAKAHDLIYADGLRTSLSWNDYPQLDAGPDYRVDIIIASGTYNQTVSLPDWTNLVSVTGNPADVEIYNNANSGGVMHQYAACYVEGITFHSVDNGTTDPGGTGPKYPLHITCNQGTLVFANCKFLHRNYGGGANAVGADSGGGLAVWFYNCNFDSTQHPNMSNCHGDPGAVESLEYGFISCTTTPSTGTSLGYNTLTPVPPPAQPIDQVYARGNGCTISADGNATLITSGTALPITAIGYNQRNAYYPSDIGSSVTRVLGSADAVAFSPPIGREYHIPLPITRAIHTTGRGVVAAAAGGVVGITTSRTSLSALAYGVPDSLPTLTSGNNAADFYFFTTFYPQDTAKNRAWAHVQAKSGAPSLMGSLALAVGAYYSLSGDSTLYPVPSGQRVPCVILTSNDGA